MLGRADACCGMRLIRRWPPGVFQKSPFISVSM
jgi:hypothetical protein